MAATEAERLLDLEPGSYPFESRWLDVAGARIHYLDEGEGPILLFVHGNPTWSFLYRHLVLALRDRFRCVAVDLPGFGLSTPPAAYDYLPSSHAAVLVAVLESLDIDDATLVAHDWGGPVGLAAALDSGRVSRYVLGNTWAWPVNGNLHFEWFSRLMGGPLARTMSLRYNLFVKGVLPTSMRRGRPAPAVQAAYWAPFRRSGDATGTVVFPREILRSREFLAGVEARIRGVDGRQVLFVWPDRDIAFRAAELSRWLGLLPGASVVRIENCGHFLWEEAADEAVAAILGWHGGAAER